MNKAEYCKSLKQIDRLESEFLESSERKKRSLCSEYVFSNLHHSKGDVVQTSLGKIYIDKIQYNTESPPKAIYSGYRLTTKGDLRKDKSRHSLLLKVGE